jgi:hypothetical protein
VRERETFGRKKMGEGRGRVRKKENFGRTKMIEGRGRVRDRETFGRKKMREGEGQGQGEWEWGRGRLLEGKRWEREREREKKKESERESNFWKKKNGRGRGWNFQRGEGQGAKEIFCFDRKIWFSIFFHFFFWAHDFVWRLFQCDRYDLNVKFLIFLKTFYKFQSVEVWNQDLVNKNNSSSLTLANMEFRFEPCMLHLIWKWGVEDLRKKKLHVNFINFGVKLFTIKNTQEKDNFDVWM